MCCLLSNPGDPVQLVTVNQEYHVADSLFTLPEPTNETDAATRAGFDTGNLSL